ncbi:unnamed protein product [Protopolystoma xenopodis]|uniref:Uncharacterized protein n=1 Tax=Protopolystoma xenopodis TaxID=117903 RepID=A0A448WSB0_9PLAT|nr:unnamed protein product [Protopolystoma xenopodis]
MSSWLPLPVLSGCLAQSGAGYRASVDDGLSPGDPRNGLFCSGALPPLGLDPPDRTDCPPRADDAVQMPHLFHEPNGLAGLSTAGQSEDGLELVGRIGVSSAEAVTLEPDLQSACLPRFVRIDRHTYKLSWCTNVAWSRFRNLVVLLGPRSWTHLVRTPLLYQLT